MSKLVLVRHGESQWNLENRFTGWVDVPLSAKGNEEAKLAGESLKKENIHLGTSFSMVTECPISKSHPKMTDLEFG